MGDEGTCKRGGESDPAAAVAADQSNGNQDAAADNQPRGSITVMSSKNPRKSVLNRVGRTEPENKQGDTCDEQDDGDRHIHETFRRLPRSIAARRHALLNHPQGKLSKRSARCTGQILYGSEISSEELYFLCKFLFYKQQTQKGDHLTCPE